MATVEFAICLPVVIFMASLIFYFVTLSGYENALQNVTEQTVRVVSQQADFSGESSMITDSDALHIATDFLPDDLKSRISTHLDYLEGGFVKLNSELDLSGTPIAWIKPQLHSELVSKIER